MSVLLWFSATLVLAMLLSERAERSVLSAAVLFLVSGVLAGPHGFDIVSVGPDSPVIAGLARLALLAVLFTDAMRVSMQELRSAWRLPGRALLLGLPLTLVGTALAARYIAGVSWPEAFLIGAVLSPTDPVFAAAIVGHEAIPRGLRHLLNVESGVNDGLVLPVIMLLLAMLGASADTLAREAIVVAAGVGIGFIVPRVVLALERSRAFQASSGSESLLTLAVGVLVITLAAVVSANEFLAAFSAGLTVSWVRSDLAEAFRPLGELITEVLKLAALFVLGAALTPELLSIGGGGWIFAAIALFLVRPIALSIALLRSELPWLDRLTAGWFGPKGFASVVYALLVLHSLPDARYAFRLMAIVILGSMIAHSSTDVPIVKWYRRMRDKEQDSSVMAR